ncbi:MAG TPA: hypothetical protein VGK67_34370 [Myxococcales bacterium]
MNNASGSELARSTTTTTTTPSTGAQNQKRLAVFTIVEINDEKALWRRVGNAFMNRDGSYNLYLEALPVNGKLHMREHQEQLPAHGDRS